MKLPGTAMLAMSNLLSTQDSDNGATGSAQDAVRQAAQKLGPFGAWLSGFGLGDLVPVVRTAIVVVLILAGAVLLRWLAQRLIKRMVNRMLTAPLPSVSAKRKSEQPTPEAQQRIVKERREQRARTIAQILGSIATVLIFGTALVMVLGQLGISIAPILASAGIIGVAVGFGAQNLVSDFLSGIFMLLEDQYGVGDWIDAGDASGTVEHVGLRVTQLRDADGVLWFIRNGEVTRIGNHSQDWARALLDVPVAYGQDVDAASQVLKETAWTLWDDEQFQYVVLDEPEIWGVEVLSKEAIVIRLAIKTAPLEQWGVARELRLRIKEAFDRNGIQIPVQQQTVWMHASELAAVGPPPAAGPGGDTGRGRSSTTMNYPSE